MKVPKQKKGSAMDASIGVNLRVTAHSNQGGRKYMEDMFCVAYQPTSDEKDLLYAYFGIFDGHGGREAALYAKTHLMDHIVSQKNFWSDDDELVLRAIRDGFISVHQAMWRELDKWPKTQSGLPSTSGTTASVAFVRRGKLYIGHVGDSAIVLGYQDPQSNYWKARPLTRDHKPESPVEHARIQECGGKVVSKSGVPRVVWNRPRIGHKGPVRRSTLIDEIPFLAVARSLGDLWSYNSEQNEFVVSPVPDTSVIEIDVNVHRCLILGSDGLWNMLMPQDAVNSVYFAEKSNEHHQTIATAQGNTGPTVTKNWINPSKRLVDRALDRWYMNNLRADNTSVVTVVIDPPGPPRVQKQLTPSQAASASPRFTAVYTKYPVSHRPCVSETVHSDSSPTPTPQHSKLPAKINQNKSSACLTESRSERSNRRKPVAKISSKTSRVLLRHPHGVESSSNQSRKSALNASSSSSSHETSAGVNSSDVQINEISSSCESLKTYSVDSSRSALSAVAAEPKRNGKLRQGSSSPSGKATVLKRSSRQSGIAEEEPVSQRKIMRIANEPSTSQRRSSSSIGKNNGLAEVKEQPFRGLRSRKTNVTLPVPKKTTIKPGRLTSVTKVKDSKKPTETFICPVPMMSSRLTRGTPLNISLADFIASSSSGSRRGNEVKALGLVELLSSKNMAAVGETSGSTKKPQRSIRSPNKKEMESQKGVPMVTRGQRRQELSESNQEEEVPVLTTPNTPRKQAMTARKLLNTSLPSDFYPATPSKSPMVPKPILKRLKGSQLVFPREPELLRARTVRNDGSEKRIVPMGNPAVKSASLAVKESRGRITRSMRK